MTISGKLNLFNDVIRLLIISKKTADIDLIKTMLTDNGKLNTHIEAASNTDTGLAKIALGGFDLIILDIDNLNTDPIELFKTIKTNARKTPVITMASADNEVFAITTLKNGANDYLIKEYIDSKIVNDSIFHAIELGRAERALEDSKNKYYLLAENISEIIWTLDLNMRFTYISPSIKRVLGYSAEEAAKMSLAEIFTPVSEQIIKDILEETRNKLITKTIKKFPVRFEINIPAKEKEDPFYWAEIEIYIEFSTAGEPMGIMGIARDITKRIKAEKSFLQNEKHYQMLIENLADLISIIDYEGMILYETPSISRLLGYSTIDLIGDNFFNYINPQDSERVLIDFQNLINSQGNILNIEYQFKHKNGLWRDMDAGVKTVIDNSGKVACLIINSKDITDRKTAESELVKYSAKLERSNKELEDFAAIASHDLHEPLRKVSSFAEYIKIKYADKLDAEGADYITRIVEAVKRMNSLINDLLSYAKLSANQIFFGTVDLNTIANDVICDLEILIKETNATINIGELPVVEADLTQMRQLFQNLINNALKFYRKDVPPVINITSDIITTVSYDEINHTSIANEMCRIRVEDNGIGFDEKFLPRIFNAFQRLHGQSEFKGTGMGLAICRKIAESHNGSISAKSDTGKGSVFIVTLPLKQKNNYS